MDKLWERVEAEVVRAQRWRVDLLQDPATRCGGAANGKRRHAIDRHLRRVPLRRRRAEGYRCGASKGTTGLGSRDYHC